MGRRGAVYAARVGVATRGLVQSKGRNVMGETENDDTELAFFVCHHPGPGGRRGAFDRLFSGTFHGGNGTRPVSAAARRSAFRRGGADGLFCLPDVQLGPLRLFPEGLLVSRRPRSASASC